MSNGDILCYAVLAGFTETYLDAQKQCNKLGGGLPEIHSLVDQNTFEKVKARIEGSVWLGITSEEEFVPLIWAPTRITKFANWKENQPDNKGGKEKCLVVNNDFQWDDKECSERNGVICEIIL